ncbi:bifunctional transcriptional regulator/O-phospho-L-serine synthase SbnI [Polycladomyces abyssicola]|uniref:Bifunctional transcriptional regulator/O-phospho-L-serine synthase SbnI n=1 Tax=Polycladomyces abyssicola TaxID=1125966 RepID=A0A8D5ZMX2_9BACL|nr:ParB N-terminal domain-containing protein [Polycladomyces abyssicola]BCU80733.1 bifunctional transcriptional regulator/O-phospho-L-serine synthase SbnI [Polycladomyces abyssicola]
MTNLLSTLQLIDTDQICLHEAHEPSRLHRICEAIKREGVLRHPPLGIRMRDGRYLIIDGAHRTCALKKLGCLRIPLQVVTKEEVMLESWEHMVPVGTWLDRLRHHPRLRWEERVDEANPVAEVVEQDGRSFFLVPVEECNHALSRLHLWHEVVDAYSRNCAVQRLPQGGGQLPDEGKVILRYPVCRLEELEQIVLSGNVMPAGVTRFVVSGRLLNLRIPLHLLTQQVISDEWEKLCRQWSDSLRLYDEPVYYCEV